MAAVTRTATQPPARIRMKVRSTSSSSSSSKTLSYAFNSTFVYNGLEAGSGTISKPGYYDAFGSTSGLGVTLLSS